MMKTERVSRDPVQNDMAAGRPENAGGSGGDFSALLETGNLTAPQPSTLQEAPLSPICTSGCPDSSVLGVTDFDRAAVAYQKNAVLYHPAESVLATPEGAASINSRKGGLSLSEAEEASARPTTEGSLPSGETGALSQVLSEIKDFVVRLFSPPDASPSAPQPAPEEAGGTGSDNTVAGFFRRLGTWLSFGLWRPEQSQNSDKAPKDAVAKAPDAGGGLIEGDRQTNGSSGQDLPLEGREATRSKGGKTTGSHALKVPAAIQQAIQEAARKYDLSADLIAAVIKVESNFNAAAVSKEGAGGLMQLMPSTANALKVRNRFDIQQNIDGGSRYLKSLLKRFDGQVELALAAYNVGPEAVKHYGGIPPYRHTRHYVKKVLGNC